MQYMLLIHSDDTPFATATPEMVEQMMGPYLAYNDALRKAGIWVAGEQLAPKQVTTQVRVRDERTEVVDGPFADVKEAFGGYYIIDVPDLDAALKWAARCPGASHGTVEVRPILSDNG